MRPEPAASPTSIYTSQAARAFLNRKKSAAPTHTAKNPVSPAKLRMSNVQIQNYMSASKVPYGELHAKKSIRAIEKYQEQRGPRTTSTKVTAPMVSESSKCIEARELFLLQEGRSFRLACKYDQLVRLATYTLSDKTDALCFTSLTSGAQDQWSIRDIVDDAFTIGLAKRYFGQDKFLQVTGDRVDIGSERASLFVISEVVEGNGFRISPRDAPGWFVTPTSSLSSSDTGIVLSTVKSNKNLFVIQI